MSTNIRFNELEQLYPAKMNRDFRELIARSAIKYADDDAFIIKTKRATKDSEAEYRHVSYTELRHEIEALGTALMELGMQNRTIALIGENSYPWFLTYFAAVCGLGVLVPLDKGLPYEEIKSSVDRSYSTVLFFDKAHQKVAEQLKADGSGITDYICLDETDGYTALTSLIERGKELLAAGNEDYLNAPIDTEKVQLLIFTSGTTSKAKAVMLNQRNIMSNVYALQKAEDIRRGDVNMALLPYHHTFGATGQILMVACGVTTVFCDGLKYVQKNLQEYGVSVFIGVPLIVESLYKKVMAAVKKQGKEATLAKGMKISGILRKVGIDMRRRLFKDILEPLGGKIRLLISGASALDPEVSIMMDAMGITVLQGYGMTECSPVIAAENLKHREPGSIGLSMPGTIVEIEDPDENGVGELIVKSDSVMMGYFENDEATSQTLVDGWLHTGDLAFMDKKGYIHICGRSKNMIVLKNGKKVFPEEIEELIAGLPYVKENIVYGETKRDGGDDKDIVLVTKIVYDAEYMKEFHNASTTEEIEAVVAKDIDDINSRMPKYKSIHRWIVQETEMIKTTTGKVKRFEEIK